MPGSLRLVDVDEADGWEPETDRLTFVAYVVEVEPGPSTPSG